MAEEQIELPIDLGDARSVRLRNKEIKSRELQKQEFLQAAMARPDGRMWFYDFFVMTHCFANPFRAGAPDSTAFNCGEMNIGQQVLADVNLHCTKDYLLMMEEARNPAGEKNEQA